MLSHLVPLLSGDLPFFLRCDVFDIDPLADIRQFQTLDDLFHHAVGGADDQNAGRLHPLDSFLDFRHMILFQKQRRLHRADLGRLALCRNPGDHFISTDEQSIVDYTFDF